MGVHWTSVAAIAPNTYTQMILTVDDCNIKVLTSPMVPLPDDRSTKYWPILIEILRGLPRLVAMTWEFGDAQMACDMATSNGRAFLQLQTSSFVVVYQVHLNKSYVAVPIQLIVST